MKLNLLKQYNKIQVHYADDRHCMASCNMSLMFSIDSGENWNKFFLLPSNIIKRIICNFSLTRRLFRAGIHIVLPIGNHLCPDWIVVAENKVFRVSANGDSVQELFRIERGRRPLRKGIHVDKNHILFGEYWDNANRDAVKILRFHLYSEKMEVMYVFKPKMVRHLHIVQKDPFSGLYWISTGDQDHECIIATLDEESGCLTPIGQGSQKWRAVSFAFRQDAVYWGTDNNLGENQIWHFNRVDGSTRAIANIIGPVYYNMSLDSYIIFGTAVEKGEGKQDGFGRLYAVDNNEKVNEVWRQRKDRWDPRMFGYGIFEFAEGLLSNKRFWVTEKGFENGLRSILFELKND
ncbi:MAG: hypothetical protein V3U92_01525 [Cellulophaga sp.]